MIIFFPPAIISVVADPDLLADNNNGCSLIEQYFRFSELINDLFRSVPPF